MDVFNDINAGLILINQGYVAGVLYSVTGKALFPFWEGFVIFEKIIAILF